MKILAIERDLAAPPEEERDQILKEEACAVWSLVQASAVREVYYHKDRPQAVLMLECACELDAAECLSRLPLVAKGYTTFDLMPLRPYPGFLRVFEHQHL